jgi:hypothetical protein
MIRRTARLLLTVLVLCLLVACNRGDGDADRAAPPNGLAVEMFDYGYRFVGAVTAGAVTMTTVNTGREWHMATYGKLQPGRTVADVVSFLDAQSAGDPVDSIENVIEKGLGAPGHLLQPGRRQALTVDNLDAGSYVMLCYLPVEGQGTPHFTRGMVGGFEVGTAGLVTAAPEADVEVVLGDSAEPAGLPTNLKSGERTFKVTSAGTSGKDFTIVQLGAGQTLGSFGIYFGTEFVQPGGPPVGVADRAPGKVLGSSFQIEPGRSVWLTIDVPEGEVYFDSATNVADGNPVHKVVSVRVG